MVFFDGNLLKSISYGVYTYDGFYYNTEIKNNIFFIKTDFIEDFYKKHCPSYPYKIITHNSDFKLKNNFIKYLNDPNLIKCFAQESDIIHSKIEQIPIGLPNEREKLKDTIHHFTIGARNVFKDIFYSNIIKSKLVAYISFDTSTNTDRIECLHYCKSKNLTIMRNNYKNYLIDLKKSMFSICPAGNNLNTHRLWESLYMKCVPIIVLNNDKFDYHKYFPIIVLKSWKDIRSLELNDRIYFDYFNEKYSFENKIQKILRNIIT